MRVEAVPRMRQEGVLPTCESLTPKLVSCPNEDLVRVFHIESLRRLSLSVVKVNWWEPDDGLFKSSSDSADVTSFGLTNSDATPNLS
jgi:hypothetical protein